MSTLDDPAYIASRVTRLEAENNRLREALEEIQKRASLASADEWDIGAIARHALHPGILGREALNPEGQTPRVAQRDVAVSEDRTTDERRSSKEAAMRRYDVNSGRTATWPSSRRDAVEADNAELKAALDRIALILTTTWSVLETQP